MRTMKEAAGIMEAKGYRAMEARPVELTRQEIMDFIMSHDDATDYEIELFASMSAAKHTKLDTFEHIARRVTRECDMRGVPYDLRFVERCAARVRKYVEEYAWRAFCPGLTGWVVEQLAGDAR